MTTSRSEQAAQARDRAVPELAELDADSSAAPPVRARKQSTETSQVYSVRIPAEQLDRLRRIAQARGETPSGLLRRWALERIDLELSGRGAEGQISDFERLADHALERALARRGLLPEEPHREQPASPEPEYLDPSGPVRLGGRRLNRTVTTAAPRQQPAL